MEQQTNTTKQPHTTGSVCDEKGKKVWLVGRKCGRLAGCVPSLLASQRMTLPKGTATNERTNHRKRESTRITHSLTPSIQLTVRLVGTLVRWCPANESHDETDCTCTDSGILLLVLRLSLLVVFLFCCVLLWLCFALLP